MSKRAPVIAGLAVAVGIAVVVVAYPMMGGEEVDSADASLPLGTLSATEPGDCRAGANCRDFTVSCPSVTAVRDGGVAIGGSGTRGTLVMLTGGGGTTLYESDSGSEFIADLHGDGWRTVQVRWADAWLSADGSPDGLVALGCRPATVIRWIHDEFHSDGTFAVTGQSGGSSQVALALAFYGLDEIIDIAVPTGGPPHSAIARACLGEPRVYAYTARQRDVIDSSWGHAPGTGPCATGDESSTPAWDAASVALSGDHEYPDTRVRVVVGEKQSRDRAYVEEYVGALVTEQTAAGVVVVAGVGHGVNRAPDGLVAIRDELRVASG